MKNYKEYPKVSLGESDIAALVMVGCLVENGVHTELLHFGSDGNYEAYVVDGECEIPSHYNLVSCFAHWLKIYDDRGLTFNVHGKSIWIYRAGNYGCIIRVKE